MHQRTRTAVYSVRLQPPSLPEASVVRRQMERSARRAPPIPPPSRRLLVGLSAKSLSPPPPPTPGRLNASVSRRPDVDHRMRPIRSLLRSEMDEPVERNWSRDPPDSGASPSSNPTSPSSSSFSSRFSPVRFAFRLSKMKTMSYISRLLVFKRISRNLEKPWSEPKSDLSLGSFASISEILGHLSEKY